MKAQSKFFLLLISLFIVLAYQNSYGLAKRGLLSSYQSKGESGKNLSAPEDLLL